MKKLENFISDRKSRHHEGWGWRRNTRLSHPVKIVYRSFQGGVQLLCGSFLFYLCLYCSLVITCLERADLLAFLCVNFTCFLSLSHMVARVRCGI